MIEDSRWGRGIYVLPTSEYHALGIDENSTITSLNFVCVRESDEVFFNFLNDYRFFLSTISIGGDLQLVYQESLDLIMQLQSVDLISKGELYKHYVVNFLVEFNVRSNREFDKIAIYRNQNEKKIFDIGRVTYQFYNYQKTTSPVLDHPFSIVDDSSFNLNPRFSVDGADEYIYDSISVRLLNAVSGSIELDDSKLITFDVNGDCEGYNCTNEFNPYFTSTNEFMTYTLKPTIKYTVSGVTYSDTYRFPIIYYRELEESKYFEVCNNFINVLDYTNY